MNTPPPYLLISGNPAITQVFARLLARKLEVGCISPGHHSLRISHLGGEVYQENLRKAWEEAWVTGKSLVVDLGSNLHQQLPVVRSLVRKSANKSLWIKLETSSKEGANCLFHEMCHNNHPSGHMSCLHLDPTQASLEVMLEKALTFIEQPAPCEIGHTHLAPFSEPLRAPESAPYHYRNRMSLAS